MSWFPVDDAFHSHPKAIKAGDEACGFWSRAGSFCMAYLTDGFVPEWWVKQQPRGMVKARKLVSAELWTYPANKDGEQGFQFHDWKHECTKVVVLANREKARLRKQKSRESQGESHRDGTSDSQVESRRSSGPTQPNPTQPIDSVETFREGVALVDAQEPPPRCSKHLNHTGDIPNCMGCKNARIANEAWTADDLGRRRRANAEAANRRRNCPHCDEWGHIDFIDEDGTERVRDCTEHQEVS